jgi:4-amino-4-deoxy-L-arabinose transferase-like glycosyltransferase
MRVSDRALFVALLLLAAALRFGALDREEIWLDEAQSIRNASGSLQGTIDALARDNKPPVYYFVLKAWLGLFGPSAVALRLFSAVCGVLAVAAVWLLGSPTVPPAAARVAALILAVHPLAVHYSREGRGYSLLILLSLLTILTLSRAIESGSRGWWVAWAASLALCTMTYYLGVIFILVSAVQIAVARRRDAVRPWILSAMAAMLPLVAWIPVLLRQREVTVSSIWWFRRFWDAWGPLEPFARSLVLLTPGGAAPPWVGMPWSASLQPVVVLAGLAAIVSFLYARSDEGRSFLPFQIVTLAALVVPLVILWVVSQVTFPVYLVGRADIVAMPGALLAIAGGIVLAKRRDVSVVVGALVATAALGGLMAYFGLNPPNVERPVLEPLAATLRQGDLVISTGLTRPTAQYWVSRATEGVEFDSYPGEMAGHAAYFDPARWDRAYLEAEADAVHDRLRDTFRGGGRAFALLVDHESVRPLLYMMESRCRIEIVGRYRLRREGSMVEVARLTPRETR